MSGQILRGHYQIVRALSSGGFGQTFLAQDTDIPGNPVCVVKQLKPLSQTPAHLEVARQLFEREAQKLTLLGNHDQIPRLLAYFKENNEFYLVQEYIEGHTLDVELPLGQRWTEAQVVDLLQQMLTVLVYVHDEGVIHRDIKPANIIRRKRDNKLVLIDFGAVKEVAQPGGIPGQPMTVATGTQIGTAGYMPTEQGRGKPKPSSDLYALGMIGIQALTGRYPHQLEEDPNTGETVWQNLTQVSPGLVQVLTQMTRYHFKDRYQSAVEALQAVRKLASTSGTTPSGAARTVAATQMAMETVQELTLEWTEQGQTRTQIIRPQQPTKFPDRVRIGRDPAQCDIVLSNPTVSALNVEIVFDSQQRFLVRNLRENNPPYINGQPLSEGEAALHQGSVLRLGEAEVRVTSLTQRQYPVGSVPSGSFSTPQPSSPQPVAPTLQAGRSPDSYRMNADEYATSVSGKASSSGSTPVNLLTTPSTNPISLTNHIPPRSNRLSVILGTSAAVLLAVVGGIVIASNQNSIPGVDPVPKPVRIDASNPQCRRITPTTGVNAKLRDQPERNLEEAKLIAQGTLVLALKAESDFVQVQLPDGSQGWVYIDQLQSCSEASTTANPPQSQPSASQPQPPTQEQATKEPDLSSKEKCEAAAGVGAWHNGKCVYDNIPSKSQNDAASTTANPPQSQPSTSQSQPPAPEQATKEPDLSSKEKCEAAVGGGTWHNGKCVYDNIPSESQEDAAKQAEIQKLQSWLSQVESLIAQKEGELLNCEGAAPAEGVCDEIKETLAALRTKAEKLKYEIDYVSRQGH